MNLGEGHPRVTRILWLQTAAMEIESEPHPAFTQQGIQQGSQLRPRLEADYLVTKHTSVVALDQPSGRREPPSQVAAP